MMGARSTLETNLHFNLVVQKVPLLGAEDWSAETGFTML